MKRVTSLWRAQRSAPVVARRVGHFTASRVNTGPDAAGSPHRQMWTRASPWTPRSDRRGRRSPMPTRGFRPAGVGARRGVWPTAAECPQVFPSASRPLAARPEWLSPPAWWRVRCPLWSLRALQWTAGGAQRVPGAWRATERLPRAHRARQSSPPCQPFGHRLRRFGH